MSDSSQGPGYGQNLQLQPRESDQLGAPPWPADYRTVQLPSANAQSQPTPPETPVAVPVVAPPERLVAKREWGVPLVVGLASLAVGVLIGAAAQSPVVSASTTPAATVTATTTVTAAARPVAAPTRTVTAPAAPAATVTVAANASGMAPPAQPDSVAALEQGGTLKVGEDVQPGAYKAKVGPDGNCYWARLKDSSGDNIIANDDLGQGSVRLTIQTTDKYIETSGCVDWTLA